jgi:hypothetical protein
MPQCEGICKGSGLRCRKLARRGELTCSIVDHVCEEDSVADKVLKYTNLPEVLANMIEKFIPNYPTTAYLLGGYDVSDFLDRPFSIDSITMDITNPSMDVVKLPTFYHNEDNNKDRWRGSYVTSCALNGLLYVFGGREDNRRKVATYHPLSDTWDTTTIPMIPGHCDECSPVVIGSNIYVVTSYSREISMYMLDTISLTWSEIQVTMPHIIPSHICSIDKVIYAFEQDLSLSNGTRVYTFNTEVTSHPEWGLFAEIDDDLQFELIHRRIVVVKNKIYLFGGHRGFFHVFDVGNRNKNCTQLQCNYDGGYRPFLLDDERYIYVVSSDGRTIETYDIEKNRWLLKSVIIPRKYDRYEFTVVTLPGLSFHVSGYEF